MQQPPQTDEEKRKKESLRKVVQIAKQRPVATSFAATLLAASIFVAGEIGRAVYPDHVTNFCHESIFQ